MNDIITIKIHGGKNFKKTNNFLERMLNLIKMGRLDYYGSKGVKALSNATPIGDTGKTANSWYYEIVRGMGNTRLIFHNSNVPEGANVSVAILLQYGHATRSGIFIEGRDYITPAIEPIINDIVKWITEEVTAS